MVFASSFVRGAGVARDCGARILNAPGGAANWREDAAGGTLGYASCWPNRTARKSEDEKAKVDPGGGDRPDAHYRGERFSRSHPCRAPPRTSDRSPSRPREPRKRSRTSRPVSCCSTTSSTRTRPSSSGEPARSTRASQWRIGARRRPTITRSGCSKDHDAALAILKEYAPTTAERLSRVPTERERDWFETVEVPLRRRPQAGARLPLPGRHAAPRREVPRRPRRGRPIRPFAARDRARRPATSRST